MSELQMYKMEMVFSLDMTNITVSHLMEEMFGHTASPILKDAMQIKIAQTVPFIPTPDNLRLYEDTLKGTVINEMEVTGAHFLHYNYIYPETN